MLCFHTVFKITRQHSCALKRNRMSKLASLSEWIILPLFFIYPSQLQNKSFKLICCLFFLVLSTKLLKFQFSLGLNPLMCVSLEGLTPFLLFSLFFFKLASSFRSKRYLMCKEERQWINNQSSPSLCPKANGFSLLSLCWGSFIVYKRHC